MICEISYSEQLDVLSDIIASVP